jgi:hypothetical protein
MTLIEKDSKGLPSLPEYTVDSERMVRKSDDDIALPTSQVLCLGSTWQNMDDSEIQQLRCR